MLLARPAAAAALILAMLIAPTAAVADVEPNNGLLQAEGPLSGGQPYTGVTATDNDVDWYVFYANSQVELDIAATSSEDCEGSLQLLNENGSSIDSTGIYQDSVDHIRYTTPVGVNRFYLYAYCDFTGRHYQFTINPAGGVTSGPSAFGQTTPLGEPNEASSQAIGPLVGGIDYEGVQGTDNDQDWFYFYVTGPRALNITSTSRDGCDGSLYLYGEDSDYGSLASSFPDLNTVDHMTYTAPAGTSRLYLQAGCDNTGDHYQFRIEPADAIVASPPPPPVTSPACFKAKARRAFYRNRIRRLRRNIQYTSSTVRRARYRRNLRVARLRLAAARAAVRANCV
jgi:hypothetical protein